MSCSKDSDLLADYVAIDLDNALVSVDLVVDDSYFLDNSNDEVVLDVLSNDIILNPENVTIIQVSTPEFGRAVLNDDRTITYTPNNNSSDYFTDSFNYTTESIDENNLSNTQVGTVKISAELGPLKAFPGAEGYGKNATGGRGGKIIHVTNLNDNGKGSLREAVEVEYGPRTIVFDISGYIKLNKTLKIRPGHGNITIAGQTAPGEGITIRGASIWVNDSNVILRYIRLRPGYSWNPGSSDPNIENYEPDDCMRIVAWNNQHIKDIIFDHCSFSWGRDGVLDMGTGSSGSIKNVTVENCIISENIDKSYASLISGVIDKVSYHKNLIAHNSARNIAIDAVDGNIEFINNIVYGFVRGSWITYGSNVNIVGNSYITNPAVDRRLETIQLIPGDHNGEKSKTRIYLNDNLEDGSPVSTNSGLGPHIINSPTSSLTIEPVSSNVVKQVVLTKVGSSLFRDSVDERVISDVNTLSGKVIKNESEVGGFPILETTTRDENYDVDGDGIPDNWEISNNLNPNDEKDGNLDKNGDGYTNLEHYLHIISL